LLAATFGLKRIPVSRGINGRAKFTNALFSFKCTKVTSKVTSHMRPKRRRMPLDSKFIRQKEAKELYDKVSKGDDHGVEFPTAEPQLRNIITIAKMKLEVKGFSDDLTADREDEVSDDENKNLTLDNLGEIIRMVKGPLCFRLYDIDPSRGSLKAKS
ncbi:hypothetical protein Hamer_G004382, partial [Homarus americanus]